jgi:hypothetical protein
LDRKDVAHNDYCRTGKRDEGEDKDPQKVDSMKDVLAGGDKSHDSSVTLRFVSRSRSARKLEGYKAWRLRLGRKRGWKPPDGYSGPVGWVWLPCVFNELGLAGGVQC